MGPRTQGPTGLGPPAWGQGSLPRPLRPPSWRPHLFVPSPPARTCAAMPGPARQGTTRHGSRLALTPHDYRAITSSITHQRGRKLIASGAAGPHATPRHATDVQDVQVSARLQERERRRSREWREGYRRLMHPFIRIYPYTRGDKYYCDKNKVLKKRPGVRKLQNTLTSMV